MTIDELIKEMEEEYAEFLKGTGLDDKSRMEEERKNNPDCNKVCTANEMTLNILHKHKKIKEIVEKWGKDFTDYEADYYMEKIEEVLKDENNK